MFTSFSTARDALVSVAGSLFFSVILVGAAVVPAQTAVAAVIGL